MKKGSSTKRMPPARAPPPKPAASATLSSFAASSAPVRVGEAQRKRSCASMGSPPPSATSLSKRVRHDFASNNSDSILCGPALAKKNDSQLLSWLFDCHRVLRAANPPFCVDAAFIEELLSPRYLKSSLPGVQQMTGCLLSDLVRLSNSHTEGDAASTLPFDTRYADDVLMCLAAPFEQVARGETPLKSCEHVIERMSASHVFLHLLSHCRQPVEDHLVSLFRSIRLTAGTGAASEAPTGTGDHAIASTSVVEMARILVDILTATNTITTEQLAPLLKEITAASPTLLCHAEANRGGGNAAAFKTSRQDRRGPGVMIAARVLLEKVDVIQPAIASYAMNLLQCGIDEVNAAEVTGTVDDAEGKRGGLRDVGLTMECLVALMELHVELVGQLMPLLQPYLEYDHVDIRLLLVRGFFLAFGAHEDAVAAYRPTFIALLSRFNDPKHALRMEVLQLTVNVIRAAAQVSNALAIERAREMLPRVEQRLLDHHALVRRVAVVTYGDIVTIVSPSFIAPGRMEKTLGLRVADKNLKVRQAAIEQLSNIYQRWLYPWIPNAVMCCLNAEGGATLLESFFELLLPPPSRIMMADAPPKNSTLSRLSGCRSAQASMALFDFEKENEIRELTYADGIAKLCGHLSLPNFNRLLTFAAKKVQLRFTILRLFQLRAGVRGMDLKSAEGQEMVNSIQRLLNFLKIMTHAERGEWDALFRSKDDKISKAFLICCRAEDNLHYGAERELLIKMLKGRVEGFVMKFVQDSLSKQMMLPLEVEHIDELLSRLREALRGVCGSDAQTVVNTEVQCEVEGIFRALLVCGRTAPSILPCCSVPLVELLELLCQSTNAGGISISWVLLLLRCLADWAGYVGGNTGNQGDSGGDRSTAAIAARNGTLLGMLEKLCICSYEPLFRNAAPDMVGAVSKQAARTFMAFLCVKGLHDSMALNQLLESLRRHICHKGTTPAVPATVGWLKALTALAKDRISSPLVQDASLMNGVAELFLAAVRDGTTAEDSARVNTKASSAEMEEVLPLSQASAVVDAAAKCLTAIALSYSGNRAMGVAASTIDSLLGAYKVVSNLDSRSIGSCRRRLSIGQQLCKFVKSPSTDIGKELAVAVILSAEGETVVRRKVQRKLVYHLIQKHCDMRYAALLFLSAIGEETKKGYQHLRSLVNQVGDHLRTKQMSSGVTLSSPNAVECFLEYTIPFLVFIMAHHPFYSSEEANHFIAYQRVYHLLFDELFRQGTHCAGFVMELFCRIKQSDDVLEGAKQGVASRVLCDLGCRVLHECMGQRQVSVEALKRYSGRVFLPNFFVPPQSTAETLSVVYLDAKVHIFTHVPFRAPVVSSEAVGTSSATTRRRRGATRAGSSEDDESCESASESPDNDDDDDDAESSAGPEFSLPLFLQERIDKVLQSIVGSMTQQEIAQMRWVVVRKQLKEAMMTAAATETKENGDDEKWASAKKEDVMEYAKEQLRRYYEKAPPQ